MYKVNQLGSIKSLWFDAWVHYVNLIYYEDLNKIQTHMGQIWLIMYNQKNYFNANCETEIFGWILSSPTRECCTLILPMWCQFLHFDWNYAKSKHYLINGWPLRITNGSREDIGWLQNYIDFHSIKVSYCGYVAHNEIF